MIIKRVVLNNFKNHKYSEYTFEKGINLILGKNGVGKSSIFEAIGLALFDVKNKDYDDLLLRSKNTKLEQFFVSVEFVGNDGVEYVVERTYKSKLKKSEITLKNKNSSIFLHKSSIISKKIAELTGIPEENGKEIFKNVLCAYQNDIFTVFKSDSENSKFFNKIFEADVYDQIFKMFSFVETKYQSKIEELKQIERFFEEELKKLEGVEEEIENKRQSLETIKCELFEKRSSLEKLKKEQYDIIKNIEALEKLDNQRQSLEKELEILQRELFNLNEQIDLGVKASKIIENTFDGYINYTKISDKIKSIKIIYDQLQEKYKEKQRIEKRKEYTQNEIEKLQIELESKCNMLDSLKSTLNTKLQVIDSTRHELEELVAQISKIENLVKNTEYELKLLNDLYIDYIQKTSKANDLRSELQSIEDTNKKLESLSREIKNLESENNQLSEFIGRQVEFERIRTTLIQQTFQLQNSIEKLSNGFCPILNEQCFNIAQKGGIEAFVIEKQMEIERLNNEIRKVEKEIKQIEELKKKVAENETTLSEKYREFSKYKERLETLLEKERQLMDIEGFLQKLQEQFGNVETQKSQTEKNYNEKRTLMEKLIMKSEDLKKQISNMEKEISEIQINIEKEESDIKRFQQKISELEKDKHKLLEELEILSSLDEGIEHTKETLKNLENEMEIYKTSYEQYISNLSIANNVTKLIKRKEEIENKIIKIKEELDEIKISLESNANVEILKNQKIEIERKIEETNEEFRKVTALYEVTKKDIMNLEEKLSAKNEKVAQIKNIKLEIDKVNLKRELAKEFRSKIKLMGSQVTQQLTYAISQEATKIYQQISGKDEELFIENHDGKYVFNLHDKLKGTRNFTLLSGGEQVSMAIAFRIALAKILTKADIYILDEPTVNLDSERRLLLAENLKYLLFNLSQAFIITHDEEFLGKGYNEIFVRNT